MSRIDSLIATMTLTEKLGQMTMATGDSAITGAVMRTGLEAGVTSGAIGNILNLYGADKTREIQRLALETSRLRIPLLLGFDIIHGHRTLFPIPLGETSPSHVGGSSASKGHSRLAGTNPIPRCRKAP